MTLDGDMAVVIQQQSGVIPGSWIGILLITLIGTPLLVQASALPNNQMSLPLRTYERLHLIGDSILSHENGYEDGIREHRGSYLIVGSILSCANGCEMAFKSIVAIIQWATSFYCPQMGMKMTEARDKLAVVPCHMVSLLQSNHQSAGWSITWSTGCKAVVKSGIADSVLGDLCCLQKLRERTKHKTGSNRPNRKFLGRGKAPFTVLLP